MTLQHTYKRDAAVIKELNGAKLMRTGYGILAIQAVFCIAFSITAVKSTKPFGINSSSDLNMIMLMSVLAYSIASVMMRSVMVYSAKTASKIYTEYFAASGGDSGTPLNSLATVCMPIQRENAVKYTLNVWALASAFPCAGMFILSLAPYIMPTGSVNEYRNIFSFGCILNYLVMTLLIVSLFKNMMRTAAAKKAVSAFSAVAAIFVALVFVGMLFFLMICEIMNMDKLYISVISALPTGFFSGAVGMVFSALYIPVMYAVLRKTMLARCRCAWSAD